MNTTKELRIVKQFTNQKMFILMPFGMNGSSSNKDNENIPITGPLLRKKELRRKLKLSDVFIHKDG